MSDRYISATSAFDPNRGLVIDTNPTGVRGKVIAVAENATAADQIRDALNALEP